MWKCISSLVPVCTRQIRVGARYTHVRTPRCYTNADLDASARGLSRVHTFHRSHLHLVDVGRVVPEAAELGGGLAAAVGYQSAFCSGANVDALGPVGGAVAATALELRGETSVGRNILNPPEVPEQVCLIVGVHTSCCSLSTALVT